LKDPAMIRMTAAPWEQWASSYLQPAISFSCGQPLTADG
jgi:hypothetical protein